MKNKYRINNPIEYYNDFFLNKANGFSNRYVYGAFFVLMQIFILSIIILTNRLLKLNLDFEIYYLIILGILVYIICHISLFKNEIYLSYFKKFEKWSAKTRTTNVVITLGFIIAMVALFLILLGL